MIRCVHQVKMDITMILILLAILQFPRNLVCSKYDYLLFENFELTKRTFIEEQIMFESARKLKYFINLPFRGVSGDIYNFSKPSHELKHKHNHLRINNAFLDSLSLEKMKKAQNYMNRSFFTSSSYYKYRHIRNTFNSSYDFEKVYINNTQTQLLIAALKGIIMLEDTYVQDIKHFSIGELNLKNDVVNRTRNVDALQVEDLVSMSGIAFNDLHWYDASIRYLKEAINVFFSTARKTNRNSVFNSFLYECLTSLKNWYPSYHNKLLNKMDNPIGLDYKLFPSMLIKGSRSMFWYFLVRC